MAGILHTDVLAGTTHTAATPKLASLVCHIVSSHSAFTAAATPSRARENRERASSTTLRRTERTICFCTVRICRWQDENSLPRSSSLPLSLSFAFNLILGSRQDPNWMQLSYEAREKVSIFLWNFSYSMLIDNSTRISFLLRVEKMIRDINNTHLMYSVVYVFASNRTCKDKLG